MHHPFRPSRRIEAVREPVIPRIAALIRATPDCLSLGQGVAWYGPPEAVQDALKGFCDAPENHRYGPVDGSEALRAALSRKLVHENGWTADTDASRIFVTAGANMGFLSALLAIADPGDEVILPSPFYFNQEMAVRLANCTPVTVATRADYQLRLDAIESAIGPRTRAIVTISPNNPTGAVYPECDLRVINDLCRRHGVYHISDEAYENFLYDGASHFSPIAIPGSAEYTIALYSFSKAYGFASWRIGYMVIPAHLHDPIAKIQDTNLICPPAISQQAALGALAAGSGYCRKQQVVTCAVRRTVLEGLQTLQDFCSIPRTAGAFYFLLRVDTDLDSFGVAERLIREHRIAVIPGAAFGQENGCYLRVAYGALDTQSAVAGVTRFVEGLRAVCDR